MKTKNNKITIRNFSICLLAALSLMSARAQTLYQWNTTTTPSSWATTGNWTPNGTPGTLDTAAFTNLDITADTTVTLDANQSINTLVFGDLVTTTAGSWIINTGLVANATLTLGGTSPTITVNPLGTGKVVQLNAPLAGTGPLLVNGAGTLSFAYGNTNTYSGGTTNRGTITYTTVTTLPVLACFGPGPITLDGGTLVMAFNINGSGTGNLTNTVVINSTGTINEPGRGSITGPLVGAGVLNLITHYVRSDININNNWNNFTGTINAHSGDAVPTYGDVRWQSYANLGGATLTLSNYADSYIVPNQASGTTGSAFNLGALAGDSTGLLEGGPVAGRITTFIIGAKNLNTVYAGKIAEIGTTVTKITKVGTGTLTLSGTNNYTGATLVSTGAIYGVTGGSISNSIITVATNLANGGSTFGVQVATAGGQWTGTNLIFSSGTTLAFNFGTVAPSTTAAPLKLLGGITATNTVTLNVFGGSGWAAGGIYPLAKYTSAYVGNGYSAFSLGTLPLRVVGVLSNDTANSQIDLVVSAVNEPLKWSAGSANWDISTSVNWKDASSTSTTYQEQLGLGDQVVFDDTAGGLSPITVTLNTNVTPASVTFSNNAKNYVLAGSSNILGGTTFTKSGAGTLTIQNTNSFTGAASLNGGILNFTSLNNLGGGTAVNFGGGTLQYAAGNTADISARTVTINPGGATIDTAGNNVSFARPIGNGGAGGLTKTGGGTLTLNTNSTYTGLTLVNQGTLALGTSLSNSAAIVVSSGATLDASTTGFGFNLNGAVNQILAGSGTVTGIVTTAGSVKITPGTNGVAGTLTFGNDLDLNGGTCFFDVGTGASDLLVVEGQLNITGGTLTINPLTTLANGTYKLIQYAAYGGAGEVNNLSLSGGQANKILALSDATSGEIDLVVSSSGTNNLTWVGDNSINSWDIDVTTNWFDNFTLALNFFDNGDVVTFNDSGSESPAVDIVSPVSPSAVVVSTVNTYTFDGAKITGGVTTLTKAGTGTLVLATVGNDYGGATVISNGVLQVGDGATSGTSIGVGNVTNNAALVFSQPDNSSVAGNISGSGSLYQLGANPAATLTLLGNNTYASQTTVDTGVLQVGNGGGSGTLAPAAVILTNGGTLDLNHSGTYSVANGIFGNGTVKFDGAATVTYAGANSYTNNTYIDNGVVKLAAANVIPSGGATTGWLVLDGGASTAGALDMNGFDQNVNALSGLGGAVQGRIYNNGPGLNTLTVDNIATTTYAGLVLDNTNLGSGKIGLTVIGDGSLSTSLTLSGANNYSGPVLINGGSLILGGAIGTVGQQAIGTGPVTLTNGGSLQMNGYGNATQSGNFVNTVLVPAGTTGSLLTVGRGTYSGNITVHGTLNLTTSYVRSTPGGDFSASDGQINILPGTLGGQVYFNNAGNISFGTAAVNLAAGANIYNHANTGTAGNTVTIGELTGGGTISDTDAGFAGRTTTYVVGGRNTSASFQGTIANGTRFTGINKVGNGSWELDGVDSYTGNTTVSSGSLIIGSSSFMAGSPLITIITNAVLDVSSYGGLTLGVNQTLAGGGVVAGLVTAVGSDIISPGVGTAPGTLTFSNGVSESGPSVTNNFNLSSDPSGISKSNSQVVVVGDLTLTGANTVVINPLNTILGAGAYTLFQYSGNLNNEGGVVPVGALLTNNLVAGGAFAAGSDVTLTFSNATGAVVMIVTPNGTNLTWLGGITGTVTNNWDVNVSSNWVTGTAVVTNFLQYDNVTFNDGSSNLNVAVAGAVAPGSITVNSTNSYTFSGTGKITGGTGLIKSGTNVLTVANSGGNDYTGGVAVNGGMLQLGVATALGATNNTTTVAAGATLDIHGSQPITQQIVVQGSGVGGNGAIVNNGAQLVNQGFTGNLTFSGNTTFGGSNRWDIFDGTLTGNNHNLAKVGTNDIVLTGLGDIGVSNIDVQVGYFTLIGNTTLGGNTSTLRLWNGGRIDLYGTTVTNTKPVSMTNAILSSSNGTNTYAGAINLNGTATFTAATPLVLDGVLNGTGGLLNNGASVLTLTNVNTYTGNTTLSNGVLAITGGAAIASSTNVDVTAAAQLDVSGLTAPAWTVVSGQNLKGTGSIKGSITAAAGSTVTPGETSAGTLTVSNTASLGGNIVMAVNNAGASSKLVAASIIYGGTLTVNNAGGTLVAGNTFQLFTGATSGAFAITNLPVLTAGLGWSNSLVANGSLMVVVTVNASPTNITATVSGNVLNLSWPPDHTGWRLLVQTNNLAGGVSSNTNDWTTVPGSAGINSTNITMDPTKPAEFYRLVYP